jgi:transforming growth factor-beta-induced protein
LAQDNPQFSILVEALVATNLVSVLEQDGPFTVFAPNNEAFNEFFDEQGLNDDNNDGSRVDEAAAALGPDVVTELLLYHVIGAEITAGDITESTYTTTQSTSSPNGNPLSILAAPANNTVIVNGGDGKGATVVAADIEATNGVIHEVDGVLELPNVVDHAAANPSFSQLVQAVIDTDLTDALSDENATLTVFAPTDEAFDDISAAVAVLTTEELTQVLQYHVLGTEVRAEQISPGDVTTLLGQDIELTVGADDVTVTVTDASGGTATVIFTNVQGTNGVVHVIDAVLLPIL